MSCSHPSEMWNDGIIISIQYFFWNFFDIKMQLRKYEIIIKFFLQTVTFFLL